MNAPDMEHVLPTQGESLCGYCRRPWFGWVAYCPYCGREPGIAIADPGPDEQSEDAEAVAIGQAVLTMPPAGLPVVGTRTSLERWAGPTPSRPRNTASTIAFNVAIAGAVALILLWMVARLVSGYSEPAPPPASVATTGVESPGPSPLTGASTAPALPPRIEGAAPTRSGGSQCSAAHETAGLCRSQQ